MKIFSLKTKLDELFFIDEEVELYNEIDPTIIKNLKEIIKKGGEQVSLIRIEDTALNFDDVKDVIARGVTSEFWGETVELDVVFLPDNKKINQINRIEILKKYLQQNLSQLEMPAKIYSVESIPKTLIGKNYRQVFQLL